MELVQRFALQQPENIQLKTINPTQLEVFNKKILDHGFSLQ